MNHAGTPGVRPEEMAAELGRLPDVAIPNDPQVLAAGNDGVPIVLAQPKAKVSQQIVSLAQRPTSPAAAPVARPIEVGNVLVKAPS